jgi:uncharacterized membrane protein YccC
MGRIAIAWRSMLAKVDKYRMQLRLCLRVTLAAMAAFILAQFVAIPLGGLWAVLTAIVVTQMSLGGSLRATIEYFVGTFGGAVYAGAIAALVPHHSEISTLAVLALAVAPLALLAAINPNFRVGPFTAVIVVLGATATHTDPISSAFYRVLEVALGGFIGLLVSFLVLPARAHVLVIAAAARMLNLLADALPVLFAGFTQAVDVEEVRRLQVNLGAAFVRVEGVGADAKREQATYLMADLDSRPLLRTLLRLRHDVVIVARAATVPLPEQFRTRLGPPLADFVTAGEAYLRASAAALIARRGPPPLDAVNAALLAFDAWIDDARRERLMRDLPSDTVERVFALGFALEQLRQNFIDLARCATEFAQPGIASMAKLEASS